MSRKRNTCLKQAAYRIVADLEVLSEQLLDDDVTLHPSVLSDQAGGRSQALVDDVGSQLLLVVRQSLLEGGDQLRQVQQGRPSPCPLATPTWVPCVRVTRKPPWP